LLDLKDDRNYYAHIPYKPNNFTKDEYKQCIYKYIESFHDTLDIENAYKK